MTAVLVDIFSVLTAAAGWYYMFYSRAAQKLEQIEAQRTNERRVRLRRVGGLVMLLIGVLFFAGFQALPDKAFIGVWLAVVFLLLVIVILGLIDVHLTWKLRRHNSRGPR